MERRSFLKAGGLLGLAATPAVAELARLEPVVPKADVFSRNTEIRLPTPEDAVRSWYTSGHDIDHVWELRIAFHQLAEAAMKALPPWQELKDDFLRNALLADPTARTQRAVTPMYTFDVYDNVPDRPLPPGAVGAATVPLGCQPYRAYAGGHALPGRILAAARAAVDDLVEHQIRSNPKAAFTRPRPVVKLDGFLLEFFFYSHRLLILPPQGPPPEYGGALAAHQ